MLRFAPSPTGDMHIGNLRVAILNHIIAKQKKEDLIIRIEDTDKERNIEGKDKEILEILGLFAIDYKQVFLQSNNIKYHQQIAMQLLIDKKAFNCFCSDEALENDREKLKSEGKPYRYSGFCENLSDELTFGLDAPFTVRLKKPTHDISFKDIVKGDFTYKPFDVDSFVILRTDKTPTYNFACAVDDMLTDISTVIRGEDHLSNTPKQIHIREQIGYNKEIEYIHLPVILNQETGKKMSKRDDASSVKWLISEGYLPAAIANYLILLGYNPPCEIFTVEEAIEWFDISKISKSSARFDLEKLKFINREHIKILDDMRLSKILGFADIEIGKLAKVFMEESNTINDLKSKIALIFAPKVNCEGFESELNQVMQCLSDAPFMDDFETLKKYVGEKTSLKGKNLFMPLRFAITGAQHGPNLSEIYPFIKNYLGEIIK
ncbi:MAG: glutamate--tRNA ligase [Arcobacteraceae bacterium]